ncbi:MAG: preprotein translocase subunit SecA [Candidatus Parcubacteria bacterium]|jgi:preprotein translocase subunit SecA|nr:preprotein translocase subunit SecA [Candidatus Parcubacteria bacterium]
MAFLEKLFGAAHTKGPKKFEPAVRTINELEQRLRALSDEELKAKTAEFRETLSNGAASSANRTEAEVLGEILPEAFAVVREAARRTLGQRHFDVQLLGGMVLDSGAISEMRTGEGKTLVATLPAYLNALSGKGVHIVTVNDYLSARDAVWMGQIYDFLGLSVGVINHEASYLYDPKHRPEDDPLDKERDQTGAFKVVHEFLRPASRREAYAADITYGTNNEFGFDYLRDNLEYSPERLRQRDFNYAIVDEIDSILIDEARTPLIISAPTRDAEGTYRQFASMVGAFKDGEDYTVEEKHHSISLTAAGITKAEKILGIDNIYTDRGIKSVHHLETAIKAKALYRRDKEYVVKDGQIVIVDEFTGRLQPGRRWSDGLHQAVEAKEGVPIQQESRTYASITFQNFFRMYPKLSGMTGTAATSAEEFFKVYGLEVYSIPTNVPAIRQDQNDQIFRTELGKYKAIARKVKELNQKGQPILIGTVSIEKNEVLSQFLKAEGVRHEILNAKNHEREGEIIAQAGKEGAVTIATNMAGRGVDIRLGGNPNTADSYQAVKKAGGLFVLGTERHEARRIDNQLRGRSGRQGDPGETQFFVSLEDSLMRIFASDTLKSMMGRLGMPEDEAIEHKIISRALESAQQKIEGFNFDSRKHVLEFDDVINHQRRSMYGRRRKLLLGTVDDVENALTEIVPEAAETIEKKIAEFGREPFLQAVRIILLQTIDMYWVEHLEVMDYTRSSVNLRAYGQRDPLVEYKKEGLRLFKEMQGAVKEQVLKILEHVVPVVNGMPVAAQSAGPSQGQTESRGDRDIRAELKEVHESAQMIGAADGSKGPMGAGVPALARGERELGRNDPCWCGSGRKYKNCGLKNTPEHQKLAAAKNQS